MEHVTLYTRTGCPHCERVRRALEARGASYAEIDVAARPERVPELVKLTRGRRVVPVVVGSGGIEIAPGGGSEF